VNRPRAAYVHIPFCAHKCGYCDFASVAGLDSLAGRYLSALERELSLRLAEPQSVDTLFVGGGTPTQLEPRLLERLMTLLRRWLPLSPGGEWTVEANPNTLDATKVGILADAGVGRISLGAQSFDPNALKVLERNHHPGDVSRAVELITRRFRSWSLDLIFGVPGSSLSSWLSDLDAALALAPAHLSCYGLVYEKGTPLWKSLVRGQVQPLDEDLERTMYEATIDRLEAAGLAMYEISNFARPGAECRHNLVYWANEPYFGFGLGAARYLDHVRASNTRDLSAYLRRLESGLVPTGPSEQLPPEARARETAILNLRRTRLGIDRAEFTARTGFQLDDLCGPALERHRQAGLIVDDHRRVRLSRAGLFLADTVMADLL
jgi:oxygen-independent coproporphyrinogen-3 oxidase